MSTTTEVFADVDRMDAKAFASQPRIVCFASAMPTKSLAGARSKR